MGGTTQDRNFVLQTSKSMNSSNNSFQDRSWSSSTSDHRQSESLPMRTLPWRRLKMYVCIPLAFLSWVQWRVRHGVSVSVVVLVWSRRSDGEQTRYKQGLVSPGKLGPTCISPRVMCGYVLSLASAISLVVVLAPFTELSPPHLSFSPFTTTLASFHSFITLIDLPPSICHATSAMSTNRP